MARIKAIDDTTTYWYLERGMGGTYVWTEDENQATDMPRKYADHKADELKRVERWRNPAERRDIHVVRSKLP